MDGRKPITRLFCIIEIFDLKKKPNKKRMRKRRIENFTLRLLPCAEENDERWAKIDVLVPERDEHAPTGATQLAVEHRVQDRIIVFHIL